MSSAETLIDALLDGADVDDVIDDIFNLEEVIGRSKRSFRRPRVRRFRKRGSAVDPVTGKRKDPRRRRLMRQVARRNRAKFKAAARKRGRQLKSRGFYKKLGKLSGRMRRG